MIPVLKAEESLRRVEEIAAGNGLIKKPERDRLLNGWRRDARAGELREHHKTTLDELIGNGIGVRFIGKGEKIDAGR